MTRNRPALNKLGGETSPYLLQHADNPVHWHPWGAEALEAARAANKPILLSIGYSACHWCHVMAHESFENAEIAAQMNAGFINIKLDREERPDLDALYQQALALLGEQGGWPLTMFCTPAGEPFWGGTYFPPKPRYGRPAFTDVLRGIAAAWAERKSDIVKNVGVLKASIEELARPKPGTFDARSIDAAAERIAAALDPVHGGFRGAPKFPNTPALTLLWRVARRRQHEALRAPVLLTLDRMAMGGIYDHLGGGFARYSVDAEWLVPHFEKMLYDNALLIELYTQAWRATRMPLYAERVAETIGWLLREMLVPDGAAFAAALDADSEGEEGRAAVWSAEELGAMLGEGFTEFARAYDVTDEGNWEGRVILNRLRVAHGDQASEARLAAARGKLLAVRNKRVQPGRDDKALADWNGLAIAALAEAGAAFGRQEWIAAARAAFAFVIARMQKNGRLMHAWRAGAARHPASLDDYAALARAGIILCEVTGERAPLNTARALVAALDERYWDEDGGGYFFAAADTGDLLVRGKTAIDHASPNGNGLMVEVLARLFYLTGDDAYDRRARALLDAFAGEGERASIGQATLLASAELLVNALEVVIVGARDDGRRDALRDAVCAADIPNRVLTQIEPGEALPQGHPAAGKGLVKGEPAVYLCQQGTCSQPLTDPNSLKAELARR